MIPKNWKIIILFLLFVLVIYLFKDCNEGFAGTVTDTTNTLNTEAIQNVASLYNKDNLIATNVTVTNNLTTKDITTNEGSIRINKGDLYVGDGTVEWSNNIKVRAGKKEGGYLDFLDSSGVRQSYIMGKSMGAKASGNFEVIGNLLANNGAIETADRDRFIIRPKKDISDNSYFYFNKDGNHGFIKDGAVKWELKNTAEICLGNTCINEDHLKILTGNKKIKLRARNGELDNYNGRCGQGDSDRDTQVGCGGGHGGENRHWLIGFA